MTSGFLRRYLILLLASGLVFSTAAGYHEVQKRLERSSVKAFLESKAGRILKAQVRIGKIRYLPPTGMSLEQIQVNRQGNPPAFFVSSIEKLFFSYSLLNLIRRNFDFPGSFRLDRPRIDFHSIRTPFPFLNTPSFSKALPVQLEIRKGEFRYPWGGEGKELVLTHVHFKARPDARGEIQVKLDSKLEGVVRGGLKVRGSTDPQFQHYKLEVELEDFSFSPESQIPIQKLHGHFHMSEKTIEIEALTSLFHDWEIKGEGRIEDWQAKPRISLEFTHKKAELPFQFSFQMDFESEKLNGRWSWTNHSYPFRGNVRQDGKKILFSDLEMPRGYRGQGVIDRSNGDYDFGFGRERRRIRIQSNLTHLGFETEFKFDHALINHLDWVVSGEIRFSPLPKRSGDKGPRFLAEVRTGYLIFESEPLNDFRGSFELSSEGIQAIDLRWSGIFQLGGGILIRGGKPREDLVLRVDGFPLQTIRDFAGRPVPSNLSGLLEGKLKLRGTLSRPEVQGYFTINDGTIAKLDFDHAVVQFQGFPPYLKIYDSNIFRGRNTLKLTGAIDLTLQNIFHGVQIRGPDSLVIWRGLSVYWQKNKSAIEAEKPLGPRMAMGLEVGSGADSKTEDPEERHAMIGPKLKF